MSDLNNQNGMSNVFAESNERQKQRSEQRQQNIDRYQVFATDEQYDILNNLISQSDDPVEIENQGYRVANAMKYSEMYGMDLADAYRDLDMLNAANFGADAYKTPKDWFMATVDSFTQGVKQLERNSVGKQIREAEEAGNEKRVQELYQTIAGIDEEIASLEDTQNRNIAVKALKYGAQSLPFTGATIATSAVGGLLSGGIGAVVLGTVSSYEAMRGEEYLQLRQDGASVETAGKIADTSALLQGIVEVSLGTVAGYAGNVVGKAPIAKSASDAITKNVFSRMYYSGAWKRTAAIAGRVAVNTLAEANEEGLEEVVQELISSGSRALAAELESYDIDGLTASEVAKNAWESYKGGFLGALVLGAPNVAFNAKATVEDFKNMDAMASNIESKEAFKKESADNPVFEGMSDDTKAEVQEEIWNKYEPQRNKKAEEARAMAEDRAETIYTSDNVEQTEEDESGRIVQTEEYRNDDGRLNYAESVIDTNEDGSTENQYLVKGKGNQEYGRILYNEDADGNITINTFELSPMRENLRQEVFTDFAEKFAGKNIEWETRGKTAAALRDELVSRNVRGKNNGLNYFADKNEVQNQRTRIKWDNQIREAIPSMDADQRATGIALVESFANKHGQNIADYDMEVFNGKLFIDKASREAYETALSQGMNPDNIGGYVDIEELGKSTKGIIYAAKKGDATTFVHENAHIFRRLLTADEMAQAEKLFNVTDHNWTRQNEEDFAYALQGYAFEGKAVGEAEPLFRKLAQALVRVYNSLKGKIDFNPELSDFIEGLFADPSTALAQAQRAVEQNERASQSQLSNNPLQLNETVNTNEAIIDDNSNYTTDRVEAATDKASEDVLFQFVDVKGAMNLGSRASSLYDRAEQMRENGADLETIRQLTGYSVGPDGVFQLELDDSQNEIIDREGIGRAINASGYVSRVIGNPNADAVMLESVQSVMDKQLELLNSKYDTVSKLYKAGELYTAKPELKDIRVGYVYDPRRIRAVQFEGGIGINIAYCNSVEELQGALVHELQHIIDLKVDTNKYTGDFFTGLANALDTVENGSHAYYADLVDDGGIVQYFLTDPYERNAHAAQRRMNLTAAQRRAYKLSDVVNNNYLFQNTDTSGMKEIRKQYEGTDQWMKAPNGADTKLTESQWLQVRTESFKNWFGDWESDQQNASKVVDENGEPMVVYHGTEHSGFDTFNFEDGNLSFFTPNKAQAVSYAGTEEIAVNGADKRGIYASFMSLKNPKVIDFNGADFQGFNENGDSVIDTFTDEEAYKAREEGHDGIIIRNVYNDYGDYQDRIDPKEEARRNFINDEYVSFSSSQIKSATDNNGDFSADNPSILFQDITETDNFKAWFGDWQNDPENASKVVDENGRPKVVYHGTARGDRVGNVFDPKRATSGPMAFFTDDKEVATSYSKNKKDTSISRDYDSYDDIRRFTVKIGKKKVPIDRAWFSLDPEQRVALRENSGKITTDEDGNIIVVEDNEDGLGNFAYTRKEYRGDILKALYDHWVMSGQLFGDDVKMFPEVLKKAGLSDVFYEDPDYREEKVYEVYLNLRNPLVTSNVSNELVDALHEAGKKAQRKYDREKATFADAWDKSYVSPEEWLEDFDNDYAEGTTYVWTRVPDWVTKVLKDFGYDGIQDDGGKYHEDKHNVFIPFNSYQIKSAYENRGTFDPTKKNILYQTVYHGSVADFDRFDTENYGFSGEGSMSFGYGTYVTDSRAIAKDYAERQGEQILDRRWYPSQHIKSKMDKGLSYEEAVKEEIASLSKLAENKRNPVAKENYLEQIEMLKNISEEELFSDKVKHLYTIEIPDDGYIKWDETISSETVDKVKEGLFNKLAYEPNSDGEYEYKGVEKQLKKDLDDVFDSEYTGRSLYGTVSSYLGGDKEASKFLSSIGYVGIDYPAGTNYGNGNDARNFVIFNDNDAEITGKLLFQYLQDDLDADILKEAADFDTWEEWYEYAKAMDTDGIVTGAWDAVSEQAWFKSAWESAHKIYNPEQIVDEADEEKKDRDFIELINKPGYLEDFIDRVKRYLALDYEAPQDAEEAARFEAELEKQNFAQNVFADPTHFAELDDTKRKKLLTMIKNTPREYRKVYAEVFNDSYLSVPEGYEQTVSSSYAPEDMQLELDNMTPAQRKEAVHAIEEDAIRQQIVNGTLPMDGTIDKYARVAQKEIKRLQKEVDRLQKEYRDDLNKISGEQKKALIEEYNKLLEMQTEMQNRGLKGNSRISSGLSAGAQATSNVVDASENGAYNTIMDRIGKLKKMLTADRESAAIIAKADERQKQKILQQKKKAEAEALKEMRRLRTNMVKRMMRKVSFDRVDYDDAKSIIAVQNFINNWVKKGVNLWLGEAEVSAEEIWQQYKTDSDFRDEVNKTLASKKAGYKGYTVRQNLDEAMSDAGRSFEQWTADMKNNLITALGANDQVIRLNLDSLAEARKGSLAGLTDKNGNVTEENMKIVYEVLPKEIVARIRYKPMKSWTLAEAEELTKIIDDIYEEGKKVYAGKQQLRRDRYEELRRRIQDTVKETGIEILPADTPEEQKKKQEQIKKILGLRTQVKGTSAAASEKRSMREKFMAADRGTGNVRRFARVMDNWSEGVFTDTLCFPEYMAYDDEQKAINKRSKHIQNYMAEHGITIEALQEQHNYADLFDGSDKTFSTDELLYIYVADKDEMSKAAVMYGNFTTAEEKEAVKQHEAKYADKDAIKWFMSNAQSRYERVLMDATELIRTNKDLAGLVQAIENDYADQYGRLNRTSIEVFNMPVNRVESYVPLIRQESSGETNEQQIMHDIMADTTGAPSSYVNRGMTKSRIKISPLNQKPVQLGLFKTWADSMERTEHFIAYGELVRDLNAIYTGQAASATREAIATRYGQDANNYIKEYINELANPNKGQARSALDTFCHVLRGQTAPAYLAWKTSGIIKQLCTSPMPFMAYVSPAEYLAAIGEFIKDYNGMNDFVKSRSVFMENRTIDPIIDLIREAQSKADNKTKAALASFNKLGMQGLEWADWISVAPGWYAVYKNKYAELENANKVLEPLEQMSSEDIEAKAIAHADDIVRLTQPSGRKADLAPLFKNSSEIAKILLQFQTSLNVIYQNIRFDLPYQIRNKQYRQAAGAIIGYTAAGILVNTVVSGLFTGDGDDDDWKERLRRSVFYATTQFTDSVPVVGQTITNVSQKLLTGEGYYSNSTLFPVMDVLKNLVTDIADDKYAKAAEDFAEGIAYNLGLPVSGSKELLRVFGIGDREEGMDFKPQALWGRR